jgi:hypothetical protein
MDAFQTMPNEPDSDEILAQFNLLIDAILQDTKGRSVYQPWEIDLLLDIDSCGMDGRFVSVILIQYQKAVQLALKSGARMPPKLSQYLGAGAIRTRVHPVRRRQRSFSAVSVACEGESDASEPISTSRNSALVPFGETNS